MGALTFGNLDAGIAQAEGYNTPGSIPNLANNPGDIIASPFATAHGATGAITAAGGTQIATFPDPTTGLSAEDALVASKVNAGGITDINSLAQSWLGQNASPTDVSNWATNVSSALGVPASTPVASLGSGAPSATGASPSTAASIAAAAATAAMRAALPPGITFGRVAAFVVGLMFILGGILALKPAQSIVVNAGRAARAVTV